MPKALTKTEAMRSVHDFYGESVGVNVMTQSKSNYVIRTATPEDYETVAPIYESVLAHHVTPLPERFTQGPVLALSPQRFLEIITQPGSTVLVAEIATSIVGCAIVSIERSPEDDMYVPRSYAKVHLVGVLANARGRGIGRALMQHIHVWTLERSVREVELVVWEFNTDARHLYEALGYQTISRRMLWRAEIKSS